MAKLKGPLFSLGASGAIGEALVYFPWKGLNVAREYVIPANPRTALQTTQRGHLTAAVLLLHQTQAEVISPWNELDKSAYALWASVVKPATTWFNQVIKHCIDRLVAGKEIRIFRGAVITYPAAGQIHITFRCSGPAGTTGKFKYGTSKTALVNTQAATIAVNIVSATIAGLTTGVKYFIQYETLTNATLVGVKSGIYYGYPT